MRLFRAVPLIISLVGTTAAAGDPAALHQCTLGYLEALVAGEKEVGEVMKTTALSPYFGEVQRKSLEGRIASNKKEWRRQEYRFQVLKEKISGDHAMVLVGARSQRDPLSLDVLGVGAQRKKEVWKPAPLIGGFEAVFLGFDEEAERSVVELERWMSRERARRLQKMEAEAVADFKQGLAAAAPKAIKEESPLPVLEAFFSACRENNYLAALACLGEMESQPSHDWREVREALSHGLDVQAEVGLWRLMVEKEVLFLVDEMKAADDGKQEGVSVRVLFYDPAIGGGVRSLTFEVKRVDKRWHLRLPAELRYDHDTNRTKTELARLERLQGKLKDRDRFQQVFEKKYTPKTSTTMEEAGAHLIDVLNDSDLAAFFRMVHRSLESSAEEQRVKYAEAAKAWRQTRMGQEGPALVEVIEHGQAGVAVVSQLDTEKLNWVQLTPINFLKGESGWVIAPGVTGGGNFEAMPEDAHKDSVALAVEYMGRLDELRGKATQPLLDLLGVMGGLSGKGITEEIAVSLIKSYRAQLREGHLQRALRFCGLVERETGKQWEGTQIISYEARGARAAHGPDEILLVQEEGAWTAISLQVSAPPHGEPHYPMYLVVPTDHGPRILMDAHLRLATNKGRTLLNEKILDMLREHLEEAQVDLVETLFRSHVTIAEKHFQEWQKNTKSSP